MKICILGAGVIGVSTAYAFARLGHEVSVIDKEADVAAGASHANGAQLSYSYVDPFAGPQVLKRLPSYIMGMDAGIKLGFSLSPAYLKWGLDFIRNCAPGMVRANLMAQWKLAQASQAALSVFECELPKDAIRRTANGKIILAYSERDLSEMARTTTSKNDIGISLTVLSKNECLEREPALASWSEDFAGGIYNADDTTLDPLIYCKALQSEAERSWNAKFFWRETVLAVELCNAKVAGVQTNRGYHAYDHVIVCLGNEANMILRPLGLAVPIYPLQGYSLTLPVGAGPPKISLTDPHHKIVFANLGAQMRIAGFMDANQSAQNATKRTGHLLQTARRLWPDIADYDAAPHSWTHFRPMTPSGVPIIGKTHIEGLSLNVGHGALGYTFAAGSAMKIAHEIGQAQAIIEPNEGGQTYASKA